MDLIYEELDYIIKENDIKIGGLERKIERLEQMNELCRSIKEDYKEEEKERKENGRKENFIY